MFNSIKTYLTIYKSRFDSLEITRKIICIDQLILLTVLYFVVSYFVFLFYLEHDRIVYDNQLYLKCLLYQSTQNLYNERLDISFYITGKVKIFFRSTKYISPHCLAIFSSVA